MKAAAGNALGGLAFTLVFAIAVTLGKSVAGLLSASALFALAGATGLFVMSRVKKGDPKRYFALSLSWLCAFSAILWLAMAIAS